MGVQNHAIFFIAVAATVLAGSCRDRALAATEFCPAKVAEMTTAGQSSNMESSAVRPRVIANASVPGANIRPTGNLGDVNKDNVASTAFAYELQAETPRTIVTASIVADTDHGWYSWNAASVSLEKVSEPLVGRFMEGTVVYARSTPQTVTFPADVLVRHAWVVRARTSGEAKFGCSSSGNPGADVSALRAARQSSYKPAISYCQPVKAEYLFRAEFQHQ
jgi:hypothetical protein